MTEGSDFGTAAAVLAAISAAIQTIKNAADTIKGVLPKAGADKAMLNEARESVISVESALLDAKEEILRLKREALRLEDKNAELLAKLREKEEWSLEREKYETKKFAQGYAVAPKGEEGPLFCVQCFGSGKLEVLSDTGFRAKNEAPSHLCPVCKKRFVLL